MNGAVILVGIVGFFALVIGLMAYSVLIQQPRLRRQLQEESTHHGWTYTPGKSLVVTQRSANGHLLSPQETISESFEGSDQGVHWHMEAMSITRKNAAPQSRFSAASTNQTAATSISHHIFWHCDDFRIDHGSVLLYVKPLGWTEGASASGVVKAGLGAIHSSFMNSIVRENWGIQNTPITLDLPDLEAKYQVEASDIAAAKTALTPDVVQFLTRQRPPDSIIHVGDNGIHIIVTNDTYLSKFEKLVALVDYGVQLAKVVSVSQTVPKS